jgi:DNA-binding LacI/PurR family transcriptional regulator
MKHITIKDVAKRLNVSVSTVSRAFNDKYDIRKETRELVLATAREMGYVPNPFAKGLLKQCSNQIGVVVPEFINAFFHEVIIGIQEILLSEGYQLLIMQSNENPATELENVKTLERNMIDGLIISLTAGNSNLKYFQQLISMGMPIVFFNRTNAELKASTVLFDDYKWAFFATEHLIREGYKWIVHLMGDKSVLLSVNRKQGFVDAHRKNKLSVSKDQIFQCGFLMSDGERVARQMIERGNIPDAIFAVNDPSAIGAMRTFKKFGYKIPGDVAIVGFTESKLAEMIDPPLTSVAQPTFEIGQTAARLLLNQINSKGLFIPQTIVLNGKLNIRESSKRF